MYARAKIVKKKHWRPKPGVPWWRSEICYTESLFAATT